MSEKKACPSCTHIHSAVPWLNLELAKNLHEQESKNGEATNKKLHDNTSEKCEKE